MIKSVCCFVRMIDTLLVADILIYLDILRGHLNASREEILKIEINFFDGGYGVFFFVFCFLDIERICVCVCVSDKTFQCLLVPSPAATRGALSVWPRACAAGT